MLYIFYKLKFRIIDKITFVDFFIDSLIIAIFTL